MPDKKFVDFSDEELLKLIQSGAIGAFEEVYKRYWKMLFGTAFKRLKNKMLCEEIVQDIFTLFWKKRNEIVITTGLKNYLFKSVTYHTIDHFRKEALRTKYELSLVSAPFFANTVEEDILVNDMSEHISSIVDDLPEKCRTVYKLSRVDYKSNKEIASILGISEKTVENHLTKALNRIRSNMEVILTFTVIYSILLT